MSSPTSDASSSAAPRAVFLSYASQDADAARRMCETLRAAGIEVWFDQNELVGGDAWDVKIRKQIGDCALFVPIISAATQARLEGYFRLEWKLAAQRTHTMADEKTFLLPVVIDATRDADAKVPAEFKAVQWTRLPGGETPAKFCERVKSLLGGGAVLQPAPETPERELKHRATPKVGRRVPAAAWAAAVIAVAAIAAFVVLRPKSDAGAGTRPPTTDKTATSATAPLSEARKHMAQALALIDDHDTVRENYRLAEELCQKALAMDSADAEIWATAARISQEQYTDIYDYTPQRLQLARTQAERAIRLDPQSVYARLAVARNFRLGNELAEGVRLLRELLVVAPTDRLVLRELMRQERERRNDAGVAEILARIRALPGSDPRALVTEARDVRTLGRFPEAEALIDELLAKSPIRLAYYEKLLLQTGGWSDDVEATKAFIARIPARLMQEDAFASAAATFWVRTGDSAKALAALDKVPRDFFEEFAAWQPKGYLAGWAHEIAGRHTAAQDEWKRALALVEARLATDRNSQPLLGMKVLFLAWLGQKTAAKESWSLRVELAGGVNRINVGARVTYHVAIGELEEAIALLEAQWARLSFYSRTSNYCALRYAPEYAPIRADPRMQRLITEQAAALEALRRSSVAKSATSTVDDKSAAADKSVAVLAFADQSPARDSEYFSDGISDELINVLGKIPGLKVPARTSSFYFKGKSVPLAEIAKQLGVAYIIDGSVQRIGERVKIAARLSKAADGFQVWNDSFTRDAKDVFAVEEEIAGLIAKNLSLKLGASSAASTAAVNPQAFELYVQARQAWNLRNDEGFARAEQLLTRALTLAPDFARAHAALADVWTVRGQGAGAVGAFGQRASPEQARIVAKVREALKLEPDSAEAHASLGIALWMDWNFPEAESALRRAIALNPNYASAHQWLGRLLDSMGQVDEALAELKLATEMDPLSPIVLSNYGARLAAFGRYTEALALQERALALQPNAVAAIYQKASALLGLGQVNEAVALIRQLPPDSPNNRGFRIRVLGPAGLKAEAEELLAGVDRRSLVPLFHLQLAAGRRDDALANLDASTVGAFFLGPLLSEAVFDPIREHPKFQQMVATLGATEAHARTQAWRAAHPPEKPAHK